MPEIIQVIVGGLLIGGMFSLIAIALNVVFGVMEIVNFAHGSFVMLGMYFAYWLSVLFHVDPYIAIFLGVPVFFIFGVCVQKILINRVLNAPPINQFLLTLGLMLFLATALLLWKPDYRTIKMGYTASVINIGGINISITRLVAFGIMLASVIVLQQFLTKTYLGGAIRATADDREGASLVGINVPRVYLFTFGLSSALAGIAGISDYSILLCLSLRWSSLCHHRLHRCGFRWSRQFHWSINRWFDYWSFGIIGWTLSVRVAENGGPSGHFYWCIAF